jgi:hypothetical protein
MAKPGHTQTGSVPTQLPQTTPQDYVMTDRSGFILQSILEMQNNLGKLNQAVETLTEDSRKNGAKLDSISHKIYAAEAIGGLLVIIGGGALWLIWKIWDTLAPLIPLILQSKLHH